MAKPRYEAMLVKRIPQSSGAPTLTVIDEMIVKENLSYSEEFVGDGGFISFAMDPDQQSQDIKDILLNIADIACEVWLYRNGVIVQAGPIIGLQTQGATLVVVCRALGYYLRYMFIVSDLSYAQVDQYTIAKALIDQWQALTYGDFGLVTSGIGISGFRRTIDFFEDETPNVFGKLQLLAEKEDGFEFYVDPSTRDVVLTDPIGSDLSATVIVDSRAIISPNTHFSVAYKDFATHAIIVGTDADTSDDPVVATKINAAQMAKWGRAGVALHVDGASLISTANEYAQTLVDAVDHLHFIPGVGSAFPVLGAGVEDFGIGDKITWVYDYGLGEITLARDVYKRIISIDGSGTERMSVEFF